MNKLVLQQAIEEATLTSLEVAGMLGKEHKYLLSEIEGRKDGKNVGILQVLERGNFQLSKYFIPSTYKSGNREYKCYKITKMGCHMLGNKLQGEKGILFTAKYVERFNEMEKQLKEGQPQSISSDLKQKEIETKNNNSFARVVNSIDKALRNPNITKEAKKDLNNRLSQFLGGEVEEIKHLGRKTYSATEIGDKLGITSNKVGRLTEAHNLKTEEFGEFFKEVTKSGKEVPSFRYYDTIIPVLKGLLGGKQVELDV